MKKKQKEIYQITPKGLIDLATVENRYIWDDLELYCYRHGFNAILVNSRGGEFIKVEKEK